MDDVIVIGAGPGGSATAHYLAQGGARVTLLDKAHFPRDKTCGDGLTPRAVAVLQDMGVLESLCRMGHVVRRFEVFAPSGARTSAPIRVSGVAPAVPALVVPRLQLDDVLRQRAIESGADFLPDVHVIEVRPGADGVQVIGEACGGVRFSRRARLAVIATGANTGLLMRIGVLKQQPKVLVAARAYFENVRGLDETWTLRFDHVPMPGYGWVFPVSPTGANIGVGYFKEQRRASAVAPFERFIQSPPLRAMLAEARQVGPIKGFPLRDDFLTSPTFAQRTLIVGEAAGLVNPLTGEGIDYALESGRIAAAHALAMLRGDDFSLVRLREYDAALRAHFQALFEFCIAVRRWAVRPWVLNGLVMMANRRTDLRARLMDVVLGGASVSGRLTLQRALKALLVPRKISALL